MVFHPLIAFALLLLCHASSSSVLPRPRFMTEPATTQLNRESTGTILLVTSSELPKQIPPPPTPTRPHEATPRYETTRLPVTLWLTKAPPQTLRPEQINLLGNFI